MFSASELAGLRKAQEETMDRVCLIEPYVLGADGEPGYGTAYACKCGARAVSAGSGAFQDGALYSSLVSGARLRLPWDTPLGMRDRITLEGRHFEVAELPFRGVSGIEVTVSEVYS